MFIPLTTLYLGMMWFMLECKRFSEQQDAFELTSYPTWSDTLALVSQCSTSSDASTIVGPDGISDFERVHYWHGISPDPPELLYRSDLKSNPFPIFPLGLGGLHFLLRLPMESSTQRLTQCGI